MLFIEIGKCKKSNRKVSSLLFRNADSSEEQRRSPLKLHSILGADETTKCGWRHGPVTMTTLCSSIVRSPFIIRGCLMRPFLAPSDHPLSVLGAMQLSKPPLFSLSFNCNYTALRAVFLHRSYAVVFTLKFGN